MNGKDVHFYISGSGSAAKLMQATGIESGNAFTKDQNITGRIAEITIAVPSSSAPPKK